MSYSDSPITAVIEKALKGHQGAFTIILDTYWSEVQHFLMKRTASEADAEDITIETFSKAFDKLETYNTTYSFNTWLLTIAKNIHIDMIRKRKSEHLMAMNEENENLYNNIADETPTIEDVLINEQNLQNLKNYIKQLKPHYQEVIQLRYFQELSYKEIAQHINEPLNNVKVRLLRAKKLLIELIDKDKNKKNG